MTARSPRTVSRSAKTGQFVPKATAKRSPKTTTTAERVGSGTRNARTVVRDVGTGRFARATAARRSPSKTITQKV
ncbi:ABC transporter ATP-binding protein [Cellulomonas sp. ACRRI]|uniref:ABC transporter ATP-binding protein n=1 Tax=Cellulomonas sp. ACRRI TaxID=2918188 RepID=UPI001EF1BCE1|nr:ABC transporter ATP-binding protein [Cellulomonas sp. ACRRI]MCG7284701.1 ABC transporter ATP-binding protein [Cellulomonas sp. ACRRI]